MRKEVVFEQAVFVISSHLSQNRDKLQYSCQRLNNLSLLERAIMDTPLNESQLRGFDMPCYADDSEVWF